MPNIKNINMNNVFNNKNLDMQKQLMYIISIAGVILLAAVYIFNKMIKKGKFTCEGYVLNTYISDIDIHHQDLTRHASIP